MGTYFSLNRKGLVSLGLLLFTSIFFGTVMVKSFANKGPALVVFTASWCASCRDVLPAVQAYGASKGYAVQVLDVDKTSSLALAQQLGLSIQQVSPPMVFFVGAGAPQLILNDAADEAEATHLLQQKLK
jgi:thiol-disulfide isomerase/thioredoxin